MIDFENLKGVFSELPDEPEPVGDEEKRNFRRIIAADPMRLLHFNGN